MTVFAVEPNFHGPEEPVPQPPQPELLTKNRRSQSYRRPIRGELHSQGRDQRIRACRRPSAIKN